MKIKFWWINSTATKHILLKIWVFFLVFGRKFAYSHIFVDDCQLCQSTCLMRVVWLSLKTMNILVFGSIISLVFVFTFFRIGFLPLWNPSLHHMNKKKLKKKQKKTKFQIIVCVRALICLISIFSVVLGLECEARNPTKISFAYNLSCK